MRYQKHTDHVYMLQCYREYQLILPRHESGEVPILFFDYNFRGVFYMRYQKHTDRSRPAFVLIRETRPRVRVCVCLCARACACV